MEISVVNVSFPYKKEIPALSSEHLLCLLFLKITFMPEKYDEMAYSGLLQVPIFPKAVFFFASKELVPETHSL